MISFTVTVKVSLSTRLPVPLSVTVIVTEGVDPPWPSVGVQENTPVFASIVIPAVRDAASKVNVSVSAGRSESVAVAVNESVANSSMF